MAQRNLKMHLQPSPCYTEDPQTTRPQADFDELVLESVDQLLSNCRTLTGMLEVRNYRP